MFTLTQHTCSQDLPTDVLLELLDECRATSPPPPCLPDGTTPEPALGPDCLTAPPSCKEWLVIDPNTAGQDGLYDIQVRVCVRERERGGGVIYCVPFFL